MTFLEDGWKSYLKDVVNPLNGPDQIAEMRRVFFAGTMICFVAMNTIGDMGPLEAVAGLFALQTEIEAFRKELESEAERQDDAYRTKLIEDLRGMN